MHISNVKLYDYHLEYVVALGIEYHNTLIEMMMLHGAGGVEYSQWGLSFGLECIVGAAMIQIVAQAGHQQAQYL